MNRETGRGHRADIQSLFEVNKLFMCHAWNRKRKNKLLRIKVEDVILADTNCKRKTNKKCNPQITWSKCFFSPSQKRTNCHSRKNIRSASIIFGKGLTGTWKEHRVFTGFFFLAILSFPDVANHLFCLSPCLSPPSFLMPKIFGGEGQVLKTGKEKLLSLFLPQGPQDQCLILMWKKKS